MSTMDTWPSVCGFRTCNASRHRGPQGPLQHAMGQVFADTMHAHLRAVHVFLLITDGKTGGK